MSNFVVEKRGDSVEIRFTSNLVASYVEDLRGELKKHISNKISKLTLNFAGLDMIDSMGIGLVVSTHNALAERDAYFEIINLSADLYKLMKVMRLEEHLNIKNI